MILKSFELNKLKLSDQNFYLFYGDNEGLKEELIKNLFEKNYPDKIYRYTRNHTAKVILLTTLTLSKFFAEKTILKILSSHQK